MNLIKCSACEKEISPNAPNCPHCGEPTRPRSSSGALIPLLLICIAVLAIGIGKIHIITGGSVGPTLAARESFGYSELFVDVDAITNMPWIAAKSRFPLGCRLLQKKGIIESDAQMQQRLEEQTQERVEQAMKKYQ